MIDLGTAPLRQQLICFIKIKDQHELSNDIIINRKHMQ